MALNIQDIPLNTSLLPADQIMVIDSSADGAARRVDVQTLLDLNVVPTLTFGDLEGDIATWAEGDDVSTIPLVKIPSVPSSQIINFQSEVDARIGTGVVRTTGDQVINGRKEFTDLVLNGGNVVTLNNSQTITGSKTLSGRTTFTGTIDATDSVLIGFPTGGTGGDGGVGNTEGNFIPAASSNAQTSVNSPLRVNPVAVISSAGYIGTGCVEMTVPTATLDIPPTGVLLNTTESPQANAGQTRVDIPDNTGIQAHLGLPVTFVGLTGVSVKILSDVIGVSGPRAQYNFGGQPLEESIPIGTQINQVPFIELGVTLSGTGTGEFSIEIDGDLTTDIDDGNSLFFLDAVASPTQFNSGASRNGLIEVSSTVYDSAQDRTTVNFARATNSTILTGSLVRMLSGTSTTTLPTYPGIRIQRDASLIDMRDMSFANVPDAAPGNVDRVYTQTGAQLGIAGAGATLKFLIVT